MRFRPKPTLKSRYQGWLEGRREARFERINERLKREAKWHFHFVFYKSRVAWCIEPPNHDPRDDTYEPGKFEEVTIICETVARARYGEGFMYGPVSFVLTED